MDSLTVANNLFHQAVEQLGFDPIDPAKGDFNKEAVRHSFVLNERPEAHSKLAAAYLMWNLYRECPSTIEGYLEIFSKYLKPEVRDFMQTYKVRLNELVASNMERDFDMYYSAASIMIMGYLSRVTHDQEPKEIPQLCFMRIAIAQAYQHGIEAVVNLYEKYSARLICPASPIIFNSGFQGSESVSCMIYAVDDSLDDIFAVFSEAAMACKNNAGLGIDFSLLRHSAVGRHGVSKGIVPLLKMWDNCVQYVNQGGRRHGTLTASIRAHHIDLIQFIGLTDPIGEEKKRVDKITTSIVMPDMFYKRRDEDGMWTMFCPKQTPLLNNTFGREFERLYVMYEAMAKERPTEFSTVVMKASDVMSVITKMQKKKGMPYIIQGCNMNRKNNMSNVGIVRCANQCQEITIPAVPRQETGSCIISSISLSSCVVDGEFNYDMCKTSVADTVKALNGTIDHLVNISDKVRKSSEENRPIGVGVNGLAETCYMLDMPPVDINKLPKKVGTDAEGYPIYRYVDINVEAPDYDQEALLERELNPKLSELNYRIWSCMYFAALTQSNKEATQFGRYPNFNTSPTAEGKLQYHLWKEEQDVTGRSYPFKLTPWEGAGDWSKLIDNIVNGGGLRNSLVLTIPPTASSSQLCGKNESTEFYAENIYTKKVLAGDYIFMNFCMVTDLEKIGLWNQDTYNNIVANGGSLLQLSEDGLNQGAKVRLRFLKEKYLTMYEIPSNITIQLAAERQPFIDQSQSMNLYETDIDEEVLADIHTHTNRLGLKTGMYYLRSKAAMKPLSMGKRVECTDEICISCST